VKAEVLYVRDDVRRMQGLYNPEKDRALKDFGDLKSQLGDFLASKIRLLENQVEDKVKRIEVLEKSMAGAAAGGQGAPRINVVGGPPGGGDQVTQQLANMKSSQDSAPGGGKGPFSNLEFKKLEDSLRDHVDILQTMNAKLNNHIGQ
jgi:hypothetical protein